MKKISKLHFMIIDEHMKKEARHLERTLFDYYFHSGKVSDILEALKTYQNSDGGFGNGIEPDFWLPTSSPMATSIGLKYLQLGENETQGIKMIKEAVAYLEASFDEDRKGWFSVSKEVNEYPHAPWWSFDEEKKMTPVDSDWGNPSSELIGYLYRYRNYLKKLDIRELIEQAIYHYNHISEYESEHEIYCYIRLFNQLGEKDRNRFKKQLVHAVDKLMSPDMEQWIKYVPMPLNFIEIDSEDFFGIHINDINTNLNYFVKLLEDKGHLMPVWTWADYPVEWEEARNQWTGVLTFEAMIKLKRFDRVAFSKISPL